MLSLELAFPGTSRGPIEGKILFVLFDSCRRGRGSSLDELRRTFMLVVLHLWQSVIDNALSECHLEYPLHGVKAGQLTELGSASGSTKAGWEHKRWVGIAKRWALCHLKTNPGLIYLSQVP